MLSSNHNRSVKIPLMALACIVLVGCESLNSLLPEAFQDEEFEMTALDATACAHFSHPLVEIDTIFSEPGVVDTILYDTMYVRIDAVSDSLSESLPALLPDTTLLIHFPTGEVVFFGSFVQGGGGSEIVIYSDDLVEVDLFDGDGEKIEILSRTMPLALAAGCYEEDTGDAAPLIRVRYVYSVDAGSHWVRFKLMDTASGAPFSVVILPNE